MKGAVRVSAMLWVGEKQLDGRTGEVVLRNSVVRVRSTVWVVKKQLDGRKSGCW